MGRVLQWIEGNVPPAAAAFLGTFYLGPYVYDHFVGPAILKHFGLGALYEVGWYAEGATDVLSALCILVVYELVRQASRRI